MSREQKLVVGLIAGFLVVQLLSMVLAQDTKVLRFLITCVVCFYLYRGANWARLVAGGLSAIVSLLSFVSLFSLPNNPLGMRAILVAMCVFYGFAAFVLLGRNSLQAHFRRAST